MRAFILTLTFVALLSVTMASDLNLRLLRRILDALESTEGEQALEKRGGMQFMKWKKESRSVTVYLVGTMACKQAGVCAYSVFFTGPNNQQLSKEISVLWNPNTDKDGKRVFTLDKDGSFKGEKKGTRNAFRENSVRLPGVVTIHVCRLMDQQSVKATDCSVKAFDTRMETDTGRSAKNF